MKHYFFLTIAIIILYSPVLAAAQGVYKPLVGIPGVDPASDFEGYINSLYWLSISIAALLAVIKIVIAGVKWMMTDVVTSKGEAKKDIKGALIGLLIVLAAVLILTVINPNLVNVDLTFNKLAQVPYTGGAKVKPTLKTSDITEIQLTPSTTLSFKPASASQEQQSLLTSTCPTMASTIGATELTKNITLPDGSVRCIEYSPGESVIWMQHCPTPSCEVISQAVLDSCEFERGGTYTFDPIISNIGYCVY